MDSVPVIDVAEIRDPSPESVRKLANEIGAAARDIGFFTIRNHGIAPGVIDQLFEMSAAFFALPESEKDLIAKGKVRTYTGYARLQAEVRDGIPPDFKESFLAMREMGEDDPDLAAAKPFVEQNAWPMLPGFREAVTTYFNDVHALAMDLHRAFAVDVGIDADAFVGNFERPLSGLALLHYPPPPAAFDGIRYGAAPHTDWGGFTLLAQDDAGGLEVRRRDGVWVPIDPVPGAFVCNVGDALMRWTNDVYVSNAHRVVNRSTRDRFSAAFFCDPNGDTRIAPMPSCTSADRPAKYPEITYAELLGSRIAKTAPAGV